MNSDDDDPDWEAEAEQAEADEKRTEFLKKVVVTHHKIQTSPCLDVAKLPTGTRLVINTFSDIDAPIELTLIDPASGKVLVKDGAAYREPTGGTLLGCEDLEAITPGTPFPCKRVLLPGKLKLLCWLIYEVIGRRPDATGNTMRTIELFQPGMTKPYVLWAHD
jgi:hypothetical protein